MLSKYDFHIHSVYSDGKSTLREIAECACEAGMSAVGFTDHSYLPFEDFSVGPDKQVKYIAEISRLKEKYKDRMTVLCGIEKDYFSTVDEKEFDYVIGSVHYISCGGEFRSVDLSPEYTKETVDVYYNGDSLAYAREYYRLVGDLFLNIDADIIGHFDLVTKFDEKASVIDTADKRYTAIWQEAAEKLLPYGKPFEINTGAISRGWRTSPYPCADILRYINKRGGHIIFSSDSHSKDTVCYRFDLARAMAAECGFTSRYVLTGSGFAEVPL